jgi:hypothetical protein
MLMDILGGIVCGLFMGTVTLGALIFVLYSSRDIYDKLAKRLPPGISPTLVFLSLLFILPAAWSVFGGIAGALYNFAIDSSPGEGLGSSNQTFTLAIIIFAAIVMLPALLLIVLRKKWGLLLIVTNSAFAGIFGWILPLLANWR